MPSNLPDIPKYKYYLSVNDGTEYRLDYAPDGFLDQFILKRHETFKGIVRLYSDKTVKFAKDGYDFIIDALDTLGINAEFNFRVERRDNWTYTEIFNGVLDTTTKKQTDTYIEFQILESNNVTRLINRKDVKVNVNAEQTIDGEAIDQNDDTLVLTAQQFPLQANWSLPYSTYNAPGTNILPFDLVGTEFLEGQTPDAYGVGNDKAVFKDAQINYTSATGTGGILVSGVINWSYGAYYAYSCTLQIRVENSGGSTIETVTDTMTNTGNTGSLSFSHLLEDVDVGCSIFVEIIIPSGFPAILFNLTSGTLQISGSGTPYDEIEVKSIGVFDAMSRAVKISSGLNFDSDYFDVTGDNLAAITNGINVRGGSKPITAKLLELFECVHALYSLELGIVSGEVRLEDLDYWFEDTDGLDISDRITDADIEIEFDEKYFNSVEVGFSKTLLEFETGLTEFNSKSNYSTPINYEKDRKIISPVRGDTTGLLKLRSNPLVTDPTVTVEGDDDNFIIACTSVTGSENEREYTVKTTEGYDVAPEGWYNLDYSPARVVRRHQLQDYIGNENLILQAKEKSANLVSQETGGELIDENANVPYTSFPDRKFTGEILTVNTWLTRAEVEALDPKQKIVLSDKYSGWIDELEYNYNDNNTVTLKIIRAYDSE